MNKKAMAVECFNNGFNCAQSVLSVYSEALGLSEETTLRISSGFGGGMGRLQRTCGAVTGAFMVIGAMYGKIKKEDSVSKTLTYKKIREFADEFEKIHGNVDCRDLLGFDLSNEKELKKAKKNDYVNNYCVKYIETAIDLLDKYFI